MKFCDPCRFGFHKAPDDGNDGCDCKRYACGCRVKREKAAA